MFTLENRKFFECTKEEKESLKPLIKGICDIAHIVREKGMLSLDNPEENGITIFDDELLKVGLSLSADGVDPDTVQDIMETKAIASGKTGAALLGQAIVIKGVLNIMNGTHPRYLEKMLLAYLGE